MSSKKCSPDYLASRYKAVASIIKENIEEKLAGKNPPIQRGMYSALTRLFEAAKKAFDENHQVNLSNPIRPLSAHELIVQSYAHVTKTAPPISIKEQQAVVMGLAKLVEDLEEDKAIDSKERHKYEQFIKILEAVGQRGDSHNYREHMDRHTSGHPF